MKLHEVSYTQRKVVHTVKFDGKRYEFLSNLTILFPGSSKLFDNLHPSSNHRIHSWDKTINMSKRFTFASTSKACHLLTFQYRGKWPPNLPSWLRVWQHSPARPDRRNVSRGPLVPRLVATRYACRRTRKAR